MVRDGPYRYVTKDAEAFGYSTLKAPCPRKTHVLSGGALNSASFNDAHLIHSYPYDSSDRGRWPDDGWKVLLNGNFVTGIPTAVYAICQRPSPVMSAGRMRRPPTRRRTGRSSAIPSWT